MRFASSVNAARLGAALFALAAAPSEADVFLRGDLRITALANTGNTGRYEIVAEVPRGVAANGALVLPEQCRSVGHQVYPRDGTRAFAWDVACEPGPGPGDAIGLPFTLDALSVTIDDGATSSTAVITGSSRVPLALTSTDDRPLATLASEYVGQGMLHIWMGWDHLAFVLCLCFVAASLRRLVFLVTAFTAGHSVSMALAFLGIVNIAIPPIEAIIALSIAWMARDAIRSRPKSNSNSPRTVTRRFAVVTAFGLVHGLGFASALGELGVSAGERIAALAFFNIGVEIGQLLFVAAVMLLLGLLRDTRLAAPVTQTALYVAGSIGGFWMVERIAAFAVQA